MLIKRPSGRRGQLRSHRWFGPFCLVNMVRSHPPMNCLAVWKSPEPKKEKSSHAYPKYSACPLCGKFNTPFWRWRGFNDTICGMCTGGSRGTCMFRQCLLLAWNSPCSLGWLASLPQDFSGPPAPPTHTRIISILHTFTLPPGLPSPCWDMIFVYKNNIVG